MAPTVLGVALGPLDGPPEPVGETDGALLAAEPVHEARTRTMAARAAGRDSFDMAVGDCCYLRQGQEVTFVMSDDFHDVTVLISDEKFDHVDDTTH